MIFQSVISGFLSIKKKKVFSVWE